MKCTKYQHACLVLEHNNQSLVIDPGNLSTDFVIPDTVVAVYISHEHPDHCDITTLQKIITKHPQAVIVTHATVAETLGELPVELVTAGQKLSIGEFTLEFFGGMHELIHQSLPRVDNLGIIVNDTFCYSGDSYDVPPHPVHILAAPTSGPWLRLGDTADFVRAVHPNIVFSTHDAHSSAANIELVDRLLPTLINDDSIHYQRLQQPLAIPN
jgi:L-ascorbate metabolism protein UlaG (beta-lactamase superfamily)